MNYPSRVDPQALPNGWNQNPDSFVSDTNNDSNGIANLKYLRDHRIKSELLVESRINSELARDPDLGKPLDGIVGYQDVPMNQTREEAQTRGKKSCALSYSTVEIVGNPACTKSGSNEEFMGSSERNAMSDWTSQVKQKLYMIRRSLKKFVKFLGPGFMIAVAYIDPGNYATDVAAGAAYKFQLLVMVLVSNLIAIFLQSLCIKLGSVTGLNLAENIREHCPPWLNYTLWFFAEAAIIATDIAEVIGTAIALKLLIRVPLVAGCAISIADVLIILLFYRPAGSVRGLRFFELFVALLVIGVVICFCIELSLIKGQDIRQLFRGYLPSSAIVQSQGLYQACGILGATVMPHSLYLGSGIVQPRLAEFDQKHSKHQATSAPAPPSSCNSLDNELDRIESPPPRYKPSLAAIRSCLSVSIIELTFSLFTFALFVNSAILIVAGASLYQNSDAVSATLFDVHRLLSNTLAPIAGTVFALALLLSGTSAGIVCTIAGQMVSEGQLNWSVKPWMRRLVTRSISITPSIIIAGAIGEQGISAALNGTQVALSVILPFTSAPLIYFTCRNKYMTVEDETSPGGTVKMGNNWFTSAWAFAMWLLIVVMNVALLVLVAKGEGS